MDDELDVDGKRIPTSITYPRAGHYAVRQMRILDEKVSEHIISDSDSILKQQLKIYSRAERIQKNHNSKDRRKG